MNAKESLQKATTLIERAEAVLASGGDHADAQRRAEEYARANAVAALAGAYAAVAAATEAIHGP